jgi:hypothetical protein
MRPRSSYPTLITGLALALLLAAFLLRLDHLLARIFHVDEYISMLAAQMTALKGAPILPSGMLYNQGLLLSYLAVPFSWLSHALSEEMLRWPSLLAGLLSVAAFYAAGRRLLASRVAGLFALTFAAFDAPMVLWSGCMRMYALASLFALATLYFVARGTLLAPRPAYRFAAVACFLGAVLSHSVAVVALPAWLAAVFVVLAIRGRQSGMPDGGIGRVTRESIGLAVILLLIVAFGFSVIGHVAVLRPDQPDAGGGVMGLLSSFFDPGVSWQRVDDYVYYFTTRAYWPLAALGGMALIMALAAVVRHRATRRDLVTLLLGLVFFVTLAELSWLLVSTWRKTRYLFVLCQPLFILLAADGLARLLRWMTHIAPPQIGWARSPVLGALAGVALISGVWGVPAFGGLGTRGTGDYDTAFAWVATQRQAGDQIMTVHPSAAYLYLGHSDYYAAETRARVLMDDESDELVDRYVGSTLVDSVETLNAVLAEEAARGRLWFVVDRERLFRRYTPLFTQQVFAQMDIVHNQGGVPVFLSHPYPRPAPAQPPVMIEADFGGLMIEQNEWLRDSTGLVVPAGLAAGEYRLLVGLYDPDTFERVPLTADVSGENAVLLTTLRVP